MESSVNSWPIKGDKIFKSWQSRTSQLRTCGWRRNLTKMKRPSYTTLTVSTNFYCKLMKQKEKMLTFGHPSIKKSIVLQYCVYKRAIVDALFAKIRQKIPSSKPSSAVGPKVTLLSILARSVRQEPTSTWS